MAQRELSAKGKVAPSIARVTLRTCLACRAKRPIAELKRLALVPGPDRPIVVLDPDRRLPGRGAWLCADSPGCLDKAFSKGRLARALRVANPDVSGLGRPNKSQFQRDRCQRDG
ncbi:MAG: YlxR family protein [Deltaproteobacteria bacterium]|nr:YlxR family protein [Deltaproteobacteria bacterium]